MAGFADVARRVLFVGYMIILHAVVIGLLAERFVLPRFTGNGIDLGAVKDPVSGPQVTPVTFPTELPQPAAEPSLIPSPFPTIAQTARLIIPVQGVQPSDLIDTFTQSRSEARTHNALDIAAPPGTPVLATADGEVAKLFDSEKGGITIYQISADRKYFYYYAHLQRRSEGISERQFVRQGTIIGYVGDTGNAGAGNYHLHFAISAVSDPNRFSEGTPINPYPILTGRAELW